MDEKEIRKLQEENELDGLQASIDNGTAWCMEGSWGRAAMSALESGACFLPEEAYKDYWGNTVPARGMLEPGTKGTIDNSIRFWEEQENVCSTES